MNPRQLEALAPAQRADLLFRAARAELDGRLWQAALGRVDRPIEEPPSVLGGGGALSLDTLIEALGAEDCLAPRLTSTPPLPAAAASPGGPLALGANAAFAPMLERAAARTGLDPAMLAAIVDAEAARGRDGRWDPASRNPRSSATGFGQFLDSTWLGEARRPGSWLNAAASSRGLLGSDGHPRAGARTTLLALRTEPEASIEAVADHAAANLARLDRAGVRSDTPAAKARAAYLAHHLGLGDALRFLGSGLAEQRAGRLLAAQVGAVAADRRIAAAGSATDAHRDWLLAYVDRRIRPARYAAA